MSKRLFSNAFSNYAHLVISVIIAFIMSPFLVHQLGDFFYGVWALVMAITGYFSLLDFGMNRAIVRYVSKYDATGETREVNEFFNTSLGLFSLLTIITILATTIVSFFLDRVIELHEHAFLAKIVVLVVGIEFAFAFPFSVLYAVFIAKQRHTIANKINISITVVKNVFLYIVLTKYPSLLILAIIYVLFNIVKNIYIVIELKRLCPELIYSFRYFNKKLLHKIFHYSLYSFLISISSRVINFTDEIVVALFLTVSDVTYYSISVNLITYFEKLIWSGASVFVPYISQLDAKEDNSSVEKTFFRGSQYTLLLTLYVFCGIILLGKDFVNVWMGERYGETVFPVLFILATAKVISTGQSMTIARFFGTSQHQTLGKLNSLEAICNLIFSIIFVREFGMIGIAFGTLIPCIFFNGIALPLITINKFNISGFQFIRNILLRPVLVFLCTYYIMSKINFTISSYIHLVYFGLGITGLYVFFSFLFIINPRVLISRIKYA